MNKWSIVICAVVCMLLSAVCLIVALLGASSAADGKFDKKLGMTSPNGKIRFQCEMNVDNIPSLNVYYLNDNKWVKTLHIPHFGLTESSSEYLQFQGASEPATINDNYTMPFGKRLHCTNSATERIFNFIDHSGRIQDVIVRAYNDGVVFRYKLAQGYTECTNLEEQTTYAFDSSMNRWLQRYDVSYEKFFPLNPAEQIDCQWAYPSLFEIQNELFVLLSEADLKANNSASSLITIDKSVSYKIHNDENPTKMSNGWETPWRVAHIGSLGTIVESTLTTDVSEPCKLRNTKWIEPGTVSWIYWAYNHGSKDYQIVKQYIDMAAKLHLPYMLIDAEWDEMGNGGDINTAIAYAKQKGVKLLIWYNSTTNWIDYAPGPKYRLNNIEDREKEFKWLQDNGIAGVKIDFFEGDKQRAIEYSIDLIECAAKYNLLVNLHGATMPRGWQRTYPNLMTTEAVLGAEWYNNAPFLTNKAAAHNATLPFTRGVVGSMDYTPCTFSDSQFPHITTHAHELALTILFESALLHLADRPSSYLSQPKFIQYFLSKLPTIWDDTKFIGGYPGEYIVMARQYNNRWYIAGINGTDSAKEIDLDLSILNLKNTRFMLITDNNDEQQKWNFKKLSGEELPKTITCLPRGGFVLVQK